jgi:formate hydrogenlyase subunit 3/multisubunit Na+/H+ antiporter MnhD subunit
MSTTIVILIVVLMAAALVAPRLRVKSLVPVLCILLGVAFATLGFSSTVQDVTHQLGQFFARIHITT